MSHDKENKEAFLRYVTRLEVKCDNALKQRDALLTACEYNQRLLTENIGQATHAIALNKAALTKTGE